MGRFARRDAADRIVDMVLELAAGA
jgi:hypothetical protein